MYFEDLTSYSYYLSCSFENVLNIGWLDQKHEFRRGKVPNAFCEKLNDILAGTSNFKAEVNLIRGVHSCNFCGSHQTVDPKSKIGSCEIWIPGSSTETYYASPSQIIHYIEMHDYLPPDEFLQTVMSLDLDSIFDGQKIYDGLIGEVSD